MFSLDTWHSNFPRFSANLPANEGFKQYSRGPTNTGSSVLGLVFQGGVALSADTLTSYGSLAHYTDSPRIVKINNNTILGAGGDYADFQFVHDMVQQRVIEDQCMDDGFEMKPRALFNWLTGTLYRRRSKFDPLWNNFLVAGIDDGAPFLGFIDKLGTAFHDDFICSGFGMHLALPLIRKAYDEAKPRGGFTEKEALGLLDKCMEILFYRDARSWPKYDIAVVTADGVRILPTKTVQANWDVASMIQGYE